MPVDPLLGTQPVVLASGMPHCTTYPSSSSPYFLNRGPQRKRLVGEDAGCLAHSPAVLPPWASACSWSGEAPDSLPLTESPRGHVHPGLQPVSNLMPLQWHCHSVPLTAPGTPEPQVYMTFEVNHRVLPSAPWLGQLESPSMRPPSTGPRSSTSVCQAAGSAAHEDSCRDLGTGSPVPVRRDQGGGGSQGGMSKGTCHCQRGAPRWGEAALTWGRSCSPRGGQGSHRLSQGRPLALSGMGARMLNDLGRSGPSGTPPPTPPPPPQQPSEDHDSSFQQQH